MNEKNSIILDRQEFEKLLDQVRNFQSMAIATKNVDSNSITDLTGWLQYWLYVYPKELREKEKRLKS